MFAPFLLLLPFSIVLFITGFQYYKRQYQKAQSLPYVPSVAEQLAALPAVEILVRGSIEPVADPSELLKAAYVGAANPAEELLRAAHGGTAESAEELLRAESKPA